MRTTSISRRRFIKTGGAGAALGLASGTVFAKAEETKENTETKPAKPVIKSFRTLGRTGFKVSDISLGCGHLAGADVVRHAYDRGVNLFDTAEQYEYGGSEKKIGEAMDYMERSRIFLVTKLIIHKHTTETDILDQFDKSQERLQTSYIDALSIHGAVSPDLITHKGFHAAAARLKAQGRLKYIGVSCHGPMFGRKVSMEKVLMAAVNDGRFDVMLLIYNFMNRKEGERILTACKKKDIGTTIMKSVPTVDEADKKEKAKKDAFRKKYHIGSEDAMDTRSIQWVLKNPDAHSVCLSMRSFDLLDKFIPLSGTKLSHSGQTFLNDYRLAYGSSYCRHGCSACSGKCFANVPVSTIMRYAGYFRHHGLEKHAMEKYAALNARNASRCLDCDAPCAGACPYGVDIRESLMRAHGLLSFPAKAGNLV